MLRGRWSDEADDLVEWGRWSIAGVAKWGREARTPVKTDAGAIEGEAEEPGLSPWGKEGAGLPKTSSVVSALAPGRCGRRGVVSGSVKILSETSPSRWRFDGLDMEYLIDVHFALFNDASSMFAMVRVGPSIEKA